MGYVKDNFIDLQNIIITDKKQHKNKKETIQLYRINHKEQIKESARLYREKNRELIAFKNREFRANNTELWREKARNYRAKNREKLAKRNREYYKENKEKITERKKLYTENNKDKIIASRKIYAERPDIKERIKQQRKNRKVFCICGIEYCKDYLKVHLKTQKHFDLLLKKYNVELNE